MKRAGTALLATFAALALWAATAQAAAPTLGAVSVHNIQGVSALLKGTVDPEGEATTYWFDYGTASNFVGASRTAVFGAGSGTDPHPARVAISGLTPNTRYFYRLVANNGSGTTTGNTGSGTAADFRTTQGFGFLAGLAGFSAGAFADGGAPGVPIQSSSHPYQLSLSVGLRLGGDFEGQPGVEFPDGDLRDLRMEMPPGLIVNPSALDKCTPAQFAAPRISPFDTSRSGESCPDRSQVGTVEVKTSLAGGDTVRFGLFNLVAPSGVPAQLGFAPFGRPIILDTDLRPLADGSYVLTLEAQNIPQSLDISGLDLVLWGTPWAASHNGERGNCLNEAEPQFPWCKSSVGEPVVYPPQSYLTLPSPCLDTIAFNATATSWQQPGQVGAGALNRDTDGDPVRLDRCATAPFDPRPEGFLNTQKASSASGYVFRLRNDNSTLTNPDFRSPSSTRTAVVSLPPGVSINPSVGAGLGVCSPGQYAAETAFNGQGNGCPNGSKIGVFSVRTPLFDGFFDGAVYLAAPGNNPFSSLIAVYLVAKHDERGVMIKVAGKIDPNHSTGDLVATFANLPQLPYSDLEVNFRAGQRSFLISPPACGAANTTIQMHPWSGGALRSSVVGSPIVFGIDNGPCPAGGQPFAPEAVTGGVNSNVNSYTPYFIRISRRDTEQEVTSYSLDLPKGITGKLAGIPFCSEAAIAAARVRRGFDETAAPSCPAASQVGRTLTGYGVGAALTYAPGRIYLAGPFGGQPLSLVTVNAATVGPFDLGTIVIRSAFAVDTHTAQLRIDAGASDPIPHILDGIPLHLRDIRIYMDRHEFTHNPSNCEPSALVSTITGHGATFSNPADDSRVTISRHFQLLNCRTVDFRPKLGLRLRGNSKRGGYPQLRATFAARGPQDSNLRRIEVTTPKALFLAQNHIRGVCTRAQFNAARCPGNSVYGKAVAHTLLFDTPLRGNVYLRASSGRLPDLVADLYSGAIRIIVEGRIGPGRNGGIRTFFDNLPDAPIDRFIMTLRGGRRGLLQNSSNICARPPLATVSGIGQNNIGARFNSVLRGQCKKKKRKKARKGHTRKRPGKKSALASVNRSVR